MLFNREKQTGDAGEDVKNIEVRSKRKRLTKKTNVDEVSQRIEKIAS